MKNKQIEQEIKFLNNIIANDKTPSYKYGTDKKYSVNAFGQLPENGERWRTPAEMAQNRIRELEYEHTKQNSISKPHTEKVEEKQHIFKIGDVVEAIDTCGGWGNLLVIGKKYEVVKIDNISVTVLDENSLKPKRCTYRSFRLADTNKLEFNRQANGLGKQTKLEDKLYYFAYRLDKTKNLDKCVKETKQAIADLFEEKGLEVIDSYRSLLRLTDLIPGDATLENALREVEIGLIQKLKQVKDTL